MSNGRDDFSENTKRIAADRVGYRCSFPGCPNATIGASMDSPTKISKTGVAAHICAAAKGGPRYDANMTPEERSSVENCIWLCQTHARLIDTDVVTYPVAKLKQWKATAEEASSRALANDDYLCEYYKANGDNLTVINQIFNDFIVDGNYSSLHKMLSSYRTELSEKYTELVLRYTIIYNVYCCRAELNEYLDKYIALPCKDGIEDIIQLFISFIMVDELSRVIGFCENQELKNIAELAIAGELESKIIVRAEEISEFIIAQRYEATLLKYMASVIINKGLRVKDTLYKDEFYFGMLSAAYSITCLPIFEKKDLKRIIAKDEFIFIKENVDKLKQLDISLQRYVWEQVALVLMLDIGFFNKFYELCPDEIKTSYPIQRALYISQIRENVGNVSIEQVLKFSEENDKYDVLLALLATIDRKEAIDFVKSRMYLCEKNSAFIQFALKSIPVENCKERLLLLEKYSEMFAEDFLYHCLRANELTDITESKKEIQWLKEHENNIDVNSFEHYIFVLNKHKEWADLNRLSKWEIPQETLYQIACFLSESKENKYIESGREIYELLCQQGYERQGLYFNLGVVSQRLGCIEEAKNGFKKEFDNNGYIPGLMELMRLRYHTSEYIEDRYLQELSKCVDAESQHLTGAFYSKLGNFAEARKHYLRSLLLNDNNLSCLSSFMQAISGNSEIVITQVQKDTVCYLEKDGNLIKLAIHPKEIMAGITANNFARCEHYNAEDPEITALLFRKIGEKVIYNQQEYVITSIVHTNEEFAKHFFVVLADAEGTIKFSFSNAEELIDQLLPMLRSASEDMTERIQEYNKQSIRPPLSAFAKVVGKSMLSTSEFLAFANSERIRNNLAAYNSIPIKPIFILSYDSIVFITYMEIEKEVLEKAELVCAQQVKNRIIEDINEELLYIESENLGRTMHHDNGKIVLTEHTDETRRARHSVLSRMKAFINEIKTATDACEYMPSEGNLRDIFVSAQLQQELRCESGTLGIAKRLNNGVIVTDDQFLYSVASAEQLSNIGLCALCTYIFEDWKKLLTASKKLHGMNFINYLPLDIYKKIVDLFIDNEEQVKEGSEAVIQWLISDKDGEASDFHEDVILNLYKEVHKAGKDYLNPGNILRDLAINSFLKRNPTLLQEHIVTDTTDSPKELLEGNAGEETNDSVIE